MTRSRIYSYICLSVIVLAGCKTNDVNTADIHKSLPARYSSTEAKDTALAGWREVFFDKNLAQLIDTALVKNYDLRMALQKIQMMRAGVRFAKGIRLPEAGVNAAAGQRKFGNYTMDGVGNYDTQFSPNISEKQQIPDPLPDYYVGLQSSWEIDVWGKLKSRKKAAVARFIASQYGKDLVVTNLVAEVASTYFELLAVDNELDILEENIALQQSAMDLVTAQKEVGKANELSVEMMQAQLLSSQARQVEATQRMLECEARLGFLCGSYPSFISRDTGYYNPHLLTVLNTGVPSALLRNRPDIRQAESELVAYNADVHAARTAFYPSVNINAAIGFQSFNAELLFETPASLAYSFFGGLSAPLLNRRRLRADLMSSQAEQARAYTQYEKTVVNSFREVYVAVNNISNTRAMFDLKSREASILKKSVGTSTELFKAGRASYLEVIIAQKNALQSQLELSDYYRKQNTAMVDLYRSLGGGWK
jgi:multidrug efflux system outer membrane protein